MKYLLIKGFSGFGDRLEYLISIFPYLKVTGRTLVVDWTDNVWTGDEYRKDFYYYFKLSEEIKQMNLEDFKKEFIKDKSYMSFFPPFYKDIVLKKSDENDTKYKVAELSEKIISIINRQSEDFIYTVVVLTDLYTRTTAFAKYMSKINYKPWLMNCINEDPLVNFIKQNEVIAVHLRGTDRTKYDKNNMKELCNYSYDHEYYVNKIIKQIPEGTKNILLLSDSTFLVDKFIENIDKSIDILQTGNIKSSNEISLHLTKEDSKEIKNIELLKDFYLMTQCKHVINDGVSRFSLLAQRICDLINNRGQKLK
jgi:hypothetical protein